MAVEGAVAPRFHLGSLAHPPSHLDPLKPTCQETRRCHSISGTASRALRSQSGIVGSHGRLCEVPVKMRPGRCPSLHQPIHSTLRPEAGSRPVFTPHCSKHLLLLPPWSPQPYRETPERPGPAPRGRGGSGLPGSWAQRPGRLTAGLAMTLSD